MVSCGGDSTPVASEDNPDSPFYFTGIKLEMSDKLALSISAKNFPETISILGFEVVYNPEAISYSNYTEGEYSVTWASESASSTIGTSFLITGNISASGELITLYFQGSENSYRYTTIYLADIIMYDANGSEIGWEDFASPGVCYIDKHPTSDLDQYDFGEFSWRNDFCFPLNYDPTSIGN
jgi:hypothetical protein